VWLVGLLRTIPFTLDGHAHAVLFASGAAVVLAPDRRAGGHMYDSNCILFLRAIRMCMILIAFSFFSVILLCSAYFVAIASRIHYV
jgi:hypothetical protein